MQAQSRVCKLKVALLMASPLGSVLGYVERPETQHQKPKLQSPNYTVNHLNRQILNPKPGEPNL